MKSFRLALLLFITSCTYFSTPQQKAERLARAYLDTAVADFNNYQLVTSSPIDTLRDGPDHEPAYHAISAKIDSARRVADSLTNVYILTKDAAHRTQIEKSITKNTSTTNSLLQQSLQYMLNYRGKPNGWILEQTYRSKDSTDSTLYVHVFKMDEGLSKVVGYQWRRK